MPGLLPIPPDLAWPFALALAWIAGEFAHRLIGMPRISSYGIVGFLLASGQAGFLPESDGGIIMLLANIAFSLILFELGYRINLRWLRTNPWLGITSLVEAGGTFAAVYAVAQWFGTPFIPSLLLSALAMATSPAAVLRVVNEQRSSGQVTERILHLSAFNCVLAVFVFKVVVGLWVFQSTGDVLHALWNSLAVLLVSAALGGLFGIAVTGLLRKLGNTGRDATVAFAIAVIILVALTHTLKFSPVPAALAFGLMARHRRIVLSQAQQNFGALGNLLTVLLFVFMAATLEWTMVMSGAGLALALVAVRFAAKTLGVVAFAHVSGITRRKGLLTGMALTPLSAFAILLLEQTRHLGIGLVDQVAALAATTLLLEVIGPIVTQWALSLAKEVPDNKGN
ncbi:cation:proton antiporter [Candidatus Ferrigenium straubiae]|jgi:Kef-type K+ transport system membrane component KefB|uniref:cation:proton antiporter n=1 Tax=Candidatus Ferrigenium straubiae TaxID=2919506 RepID=UPI003F4A9010